MSFGQDWGGNPRYNKAMQTLASTLIGTNVFSVHAGHNIGKVKGWLVEPKDLKLAFLKVSTEEGTFYLQSEDIRSLGVGSKKLVIIDSQEKLSEKDDLVRHKEMLEKGSDLLGYKVQTSSKKNIGKIKDLSIDCQDLYIQKLHVKAKFPQRLIKERLLIDRNDIVAIKNKTVVIKDGFIKSQSTIKKALPA